MQDGHALIELHPCQEIKVLHERCAAAQASLAAEIESPKEGDAVSRPPSALSDSFTQQACAGISRQ